MGETNRIKRMTICRKIFNNYFWYSPNLGIQTFPRLLIKDSALKAQEYKVDLCIEEENLYIQNCSLKVLNKDIKTKLIN